MAARKGSGFPFPAQLAPSCRPRGDKKEGRAEACPYTSVVHPAAPAVSHSPPSQRRREILRLRRPTRSRNERERKSRPAPLRMTVWVVWRSVAPPSEVERSEGRWQAAALQKKHGSKDP